MNGKAIFSKQSDEWSTPQDIFDRFDNEFGFNLDPCATEENHKCPIFYTKSEDGLKQDWGGGECGVIHLTVMWVSGLLKHFMKPKRITQLL